MNYDNEFLTVIEVARLGRLSKPTIYRWMSEGLIKFTEMPTGTRRIRVKDAAEALNMSIDEIIEKTQLDKKIANLVD